ncbi:FAD-dependent oxidoreductase [Micromonospora sp. DT227]|uniref:FAD-dependent oxidoreductase n=1 Tax=Micromonospora sp. DT227 TaxID=3393433 RepID=UPI003CF114E1
MAGVSVFTVPTSCIVAANTVDPLVNEGRITVSSHDGQPLPWSGHDDRRIEGVSCVPGSCDVVVVGGGQAGLAAGYYLRRTGLDYVILDAQPQPGGA